MIIIIITAPWAREVLLARETSRSIRTAGACWTAAAAAMRGRGVRNLMPFVYELHYSLALGSRGMLLMGVVALLWAVDCFAGAALTVPRGRPWLQKWAPAWRLKRQRLTYDLHRASGL
jgi:uncharacterized iron-regulated membrane protein